ncbi:Group II intron-encoded protein LtrA [Marinomonas spartinae]|uniref:Group II intron-encoded protein LtrA n=1 Tax=Marinomonas spartinae TaxID=1792290 RepID=A0A1A8TAP0_9GAMM|nr:reverse transcriptase/maturase family protein [Marinomonas spartinae]SBS29129.1 Group II intron-encoded protein LtrA [Marinomonas spartinae]
MNRFPIRGGNSNNAGDAGPSALNVNNPRSNVNSNIVSRSALDIARIDALMGASSVHFEKDDVAPAIAETQTEQAGAPALFDQIYQFDNLISAAYSCRKNKSKAPSCLRYFDNLEENIIQMQNELIWKTYKTDRYRHFWVFEPKRRKISAPSFRDRVFQRAIYNIIMPIIDRRFIDDSYACRKNKGTHAGVDRAQQFVRQVEQQHGVAYALKADVSKYFSSIRHDTLKRLLRHHIQCEQTLELIDYVIDSGPCESPGVGILPGSILNQIAANVYLHELDRYAKHTLRAQRYMRYIDDFIVVHHNKEYLHLALRKIEMFLERQLALTLNNKTQIFPVSKQNGRSLDYLGYHIYSHTKRLRKSSVKRIKTKIRKHAKGKITDDDMRKMAASWHGHAKHADSDGLIKSLNTLAESLKNE